MICFFFFFGYKLCQSWEVINVRGEDSGGRNFNVALSQL